MSVDRIFIRRTNIGKFGIIESLETNFQCNHHIAVFILFKKMLTGKHDCSGFQVSIWIVMYLLCLFEGAAYDRYRI